MFAAVTAGYMFSPGMFIGAIGVSDKKANTSLLAGCLVIAKVLLVPVVTVKEKGIVLVFAFLEVVIT